MSLACRRRSTSWASISTSSGSRSERAGTGPRATTPISLQEAMRLMEELHASTAGAGAPGRRADGRADRDDRRRGARGCSGEQAARDLERSSELAEKLEEAGYLEQRGRELDAHRAGHPQDRDRRARRHLRPAQARPLGPPRDRRRAAPAAIRPTRPSRTSSATRSCSTCARRWERASSGKGRGCRCASTPDDFEVFRTELSTQCATVLMLDMSRSMIYRRLLARARRSRWRSTRSSAASSRATRSTSSASRSTRASSIPPTCPSRRPHRLALRHEHAARAPCSRASCSAATGAATGRSS